MVNFKKIFIFTLIGFSIFCSPNFGFAQTPKEIQKDIQDIKDRLTRLDERIYALEKRFDDLDNKLGKRIDDIANLIYVDLAGMFALFGFVIWDRRSALAPAIR